MWSKNIRGKNKRKDLAQKLQRGEKNKKNIEDAQSKLAILLCTLFELSVISETGYWAFDGFSDSKILPSLFSFKIERCTKCEHLISICFQWCYLAMLGYQCSNWPCCFAYKQGTPVFTFQFITKLRRTNKLQPVKTTVHQIK